MHSRSMQKPTGQGFHALAPTCYHNNKGQVLIKTSEWGGKPIRISGIALCRSNYTKLLTKEKQVCETRRHFAAYLVASFVAILSRCLFLLLQLSSQALTRSADSALWPVEIFTSSRSSHFNGWIIWLLLTSVIFFRFSASFEACLLVSSWCLVSSRSKCVIAFVCSEHAVRTGRALKFFSMAAG